jgi:IS30 family transposase
MECCDGTEISSRFYSGRSRLALALSEREEISRGITAHQSARSIAKVLGRSPSTVSREISRNGGCDRYRAAQADESAWMRARRPKRCKLANNPGLRQAVMRKLRLNWAPEQISGWLKRAHPEDESYQVSHETIYRSLFVQARGVLKKELLCDLRSSARSVDRNRRVSMRWTGTNQGYRLDPSATGSGRRSGGAWPLGGRSAVRFKEQLYRHLGRTSYPLRDVSKDNQQGHSNGCICAHQAGKKTTERAV